MTSVRVWPAETSMLQEQELTVIDLILVATLLLSCNWSSSSVFQADRSFTVEIVRGKASGNLTKGDLGVNGQNIGQTFENTDKRIPAGEYHGIIRYVSSKNFVQGPLGAIGQRGDFLLEIAKVGQGTSAQRTDILFHGGNSASSSEGCIMLGAVPKPGGTPLLPADHPLARLRLLFYGSDTPVQSPNVKIVVKVSESGS